MAGKLKTMTTSPLNTVIQHLMADLRPDGDGMADGELLARFLGSRDEDALTALVRRHAPMVWGVCCRLLHNHHNAEDAFQATFLALVRKAADVPRQAVANWLYVVARQTAMRLRATAAKRGRREKQVVNMPEPTVPEVRDADLQRVVDEELSRLPDHYRGVIVLCDLEGMTRKEAAQQLGIPEGSVASRLARARVMVAKRLTQRGIVFSGGSAAAVLSAGSALASAPPALVASTIRAASLQAAGQAAGVISAKVAALTEGTVKAMFVTKIKSVLTVVLVTGLALGGIGAGVGLFMNPVAVAQTEPPKQPPAKEESSRSPVATKKDEKPPHIVEKPDMKGRMASGLPSEATEDGAVVVKSFFAKMPTYPDIRFREFFDPRYLKKHGLTDRDIAFEIVDHQGIASLHVADDNQTVLVVLEVKGGGKEAFVMRYVVYEGHLYISPEKAPDPKTGIFKPWIRRTSPPGAAEPAQPKPQPAKSDQERLVGNWYITNDDSMRKGEMWVIDEDRILMYAKHGGLNANLYLHRLDAGKDPKQIDITVTLVNGSPVGVIKGIYLLDGDELRLCLGALGKDRPAAFPKKPGPGEVLILQRQRPDAGQPKAKEEQPAVKTEPKVLTPEEPIKQKQEKVTVKFKVTSAQTFLIAKSNVVGKSEGISGSRLVLKDGDSFSVQIVAPAIDTIKRLGIDPDKHFKGKVVQVTGHLQKGPSPYEPDQFQMVVNDLTQIEVVKE
jgi:RNA polymerase sigma factor (sigma-70 family)